MFDGITDGKSMYKDHKKYLRLTSSVRSDPEGFGSYITQSSGIISPSVYVKCLTASWKNQKENTVLNEVSFELDSVMIVEAETRADSHSFFFYNYTMQSASLLGVVGPVGTGKVSLHCSIPHYTDKKNI